MSQNAISSSMQNFMRLAGIGFIAGVVVVFAPMAVTQPNHGSPRNRHWSSNSALHAAPEAAQAQKNPFEGDPREAAAGGKLFEQHCSDCHGPKAGGTRRGPSLLNEKSSKRPRARFSGRSPTALFGTGCPPGRSFPSRSVGKS